MQRCSALLSASSRSVVTGPALLDAVDRPREDKSFGGALKMALLGAAAGAVAGFGMEVVDPHGEIADIWPTLLAIPGFFAGLAYYVVR